MNNTPTYEEGNLIRCTGTFTTVATDTPVDPTSVSVQVKNPDGTTQTYTYGVDSEVVRDSAGVYHIDIDANAIGLWKYRFASTGTGQAAQKKVFRVVSSSV